MPQDTSQVEATSNSEKIKPIPLPVIELHLSEGIRQAVSQSVENSAIYKILKFRINLLEAFLETLLGLIILHQYCQDAMKVL